MHGFLASARARLSFAVDSSWNLSSSSGEKSNCLKVRQVHHVFTAPPGSKAVTHMEARESIQKKQGQLQNSTRKQKKGGAKNM